jgi:putative sterol carrier protein
MTEASLVIVTEKIKQKLTQGASLNARVKFDFGDDGCIFIDATQNPPVVSHDDVEADTVLRCSLDTFVAIVTGKQDPNVAFMMGKLKVQGSMGIAMKLNSLLED